MPSTRIPLTSLHDLIIAKLVTFQGGRFRLSENEEAAVSRWVSWLGRLQDYSLRRRAKRTFIDAWRASSVLCMLIALVMKPTHLGRLELDDCFVHFRAWWDSIRSTHHEIVVNLEWIAQREDLAWYLDNCTWDGC